ncbi:MAG: MATE family efflux transporter [Oscillospiraceae bacterium]|jgi:putative MATE family efflux protein|nr:MATE family efflux transporter [Oscillospiraceae bacterium]MCI8877619.1 MATE family efflux transporter [Oscillospiraceae bacterium]
MEARRKNDFSQGSIARNILSLAVPLTVAQLTVVLYNVVDRAFIGHIAGVGRDAFTGIGLVMPVTYIINAFANLCGTGGAPLCSIARGRGDDRRAARVMGVSFTFLLLLGAALTVFFYLFHEPILYLVGGSPETVYHAKSYLLIYLAGTIPVMISLGMNPFINSQGFGRIGMMTTLLGAVVNLILDPVFIFALNMGVRGAALATVIAQTCSAAWVLVFLTGKRALLRLDRESLGLDGPILRRVCGLGLTGFTFSVTNSLVQALGNAQLQTYGALAGGSAQGDLYVAAMTAITSVREIVFQPIHGLTQGAQPVMGYNYGAGRYSRVRESIRFVTAACLTYNVAVWLLLLAFPQVFILLFNDDPGLLEVGVTTMRIYYAAYAAMSFQTIGQNTFVALGRAKSAVFFSLLRKVILVTPLILLLPRMGLGAYGVFAAEPISDVIGGLACFTTMMCTVWREMKQPDRLT